MTFFKHLWIELQSCVTLFCFMVIIIERVDGRMCGEIDIRNDPRQLEFKLQNCTIVVGSVNIVLLEKYRSGFDFNEISFPQLR